MEAAHTSPLDEKNQPTPVDTTAVNWLCNIRNCAVADAAYHRRPYFAGAFRARATSQPLATLRDMLTLPILFSCFLRSTPENGVIIHYPFLYCNKFHKLFSNIFSPPAAHCRRGCRSSHRAAARAFIRFRTMSPILAISSAVKAVRKLSENRIWPLGGNSSSPSHSRNWIARPSISSSS